MLFPILGRRGVSASCTALSRAGRCAMPLRAKLTLGKPMSSSSSSSSSQPPESQTALAARKPRPMLSTIQAYEMFEPEPDDPPEDVLFNSLFGLRTIQLNRPDKLNALDGSMIRKIAPRIIEWHKSDMANVVVIKGTGDRAFCAGGDVARLVEWQREDGNAQGAVDYFAQEYRLDHLIATFNKPYVAFMDGYTLGGGVGLSMHAPIRIATERTRFAMPETNIGFFPDVGASFFLSRLEGGLGPFLALTGTIISGTTAFSLGLATHYLHSSSLYALEGRLAELRFRDYDSMQERLALVSATIEEFASGLPPLQPLDRRDLIDRVFSRRSIDAILADLRALAGGANLQDSAWATKILETMGRLCPTSLHVAMRQMTRGQTWTIAETFRREHRIAAAMVARPDFAEGVSAAVIEKKRRPAVYDPASVEGVDRAEVDRIFALDRDDGVPELTLASDADYAEYPHGNWGMPTDGEVEEVVAARLGPTPEAVVDHFVEKLRGRQGIQEVVGEILARKTRARPDGSLEWVYSPEQLSSAAR